jgi:hypothetical protein
MMDIDQFIDKVDVPDRELIKACVAILTALRLMDAERIAFLRNQVSLTKPLFPKELLPGIEALELEFALILAFIDQAIKNNPDKEALKSADWLFEGEKQDGGTKTS